jgi:hypothetical protein
LTLIPLIGKEFVSHNKASRRICGIIINQCKNGDYVVEYISANSESLSNTKEFGQRTLRAKFSLNGIRNTTILVAGLRNWWGNDVRRDKTAIEREVDRLQMDDELDEMNVYSIL